MGRSAARSRNSSGLVTPESRTYRLAQRLLVGRGRSSERFSIAVATMMFACVGVVAWISHLDVAPTADELRQVTANVDSTDMKRIGPFVVMTTEGYRFLFPRILGDALQGRLVVGSVYAFAIRSTCTIGESSCEAWGVLEEGGSPVISGEEAATAHIADERPAYLLLIGTFSFFGAWTLLSIVAVRMGVAPLPPKTSVDPPKLGGVERPSLSEPELERWVREAQAGLARRDRNFNWGVLLVAGIGLFALRYAPDAWSEPVSPMFLVWLVVGLFLPIVAHDLCKQLAPRRWRSTKAQIEHVTVLAKDNGFIPGVFYQYVVDGRPYRSSRVHVNGPQARIDEALANASQFEAGREITCYYKRSDPNHAVLSLRFYWSNVLVAVAALAGTSVVAFLLS